MACTDNIYPKASHPLRYHLLSHVPIRKHSKVHRLPRATRRCPEPHAPAHDRRRHRHHDAPTPLRYSSVASPHSLDAPGALPKVHPPAPLLSRPLPAPRKVKAVPLDVRARVLLDVDLRDVVSVPKDPPACGALFGVHFDVAHFAANGVLKGWCRYVGNFSVVSRYVFVSVERRVVVRFVLCVLAEYGGEKISQE